MLGIAEIVLTVWKFKANLSFLRYINAKGIYMYVDVIYDYDDAKHLCFDYD